MDDDQISFDTFQKKSILTLNIRREAIECSPRTIILLLLVYLNERENFQGKKEEYLYDRMASIHVLIL